MLTQKIVKNFLEHLYKDAEVYLERKYAIYKGHLVQ